MHRNTYVLVTSLAVLAALIVGVNMGRRQTPPPPSLLPSPSPEITISTTKSYRNAYCNVAFDYPATFTLLESATGSAALTGPGTGDGILLTCQKDIPRPAITQENIEDIRIGSVAAKLYHDQSDTLIFRHPGTKLDVFLAATSEMLQNLLKTLTIQ